MLSGSMCRRGNKYAAIFYSHFAALTVHTASSLPCAKPFTACVKPCKSHCNVTFLVVLSIVLAIALVSHPRCLYTQSTVLSCNPSSRIVHAADIMRFLIPISSAMGNTKVSRCSSSCKTLALDKNGWVCRTEPLVKGCIECIAIDWLVL